MNLAMHTDEANLFRSLLLRGNTYLEFGAGGSTFEAAKSDLDEIHCVETDAVWIDKVKSKINRHSGIYFHYVDIGPTREWGLPVTATPTVQWASYYLDIWSKLKRAPDLVLIDGRFRTACGLMSCLVCPSSSIIAIHDFYDANPVRKNYHRLLDFFDQIERATNLVLLRRKADIDQFKLVCALSEVRQDYW